MAQQLRIFELPARITIAEAISPAGPVFAQPRGTETVVKVWFLQSSPYANATEADRQKVHATFKPIVGEQQSQVMALAMLPFQAVANVRFEIATNEEEATLRVGMYSDNSGDGGIAFPNTGKPDLFVNLKGAVLPDLTMGSEDVLTFLHEIGHALGLNHPSILEKNPQGLLPAEYSSYRYSIESYNLFLGTILGQLDESRWPRGMRPAAPMLFDLAGLDAIYGLRTNVRGGNDIYSVSANSGFTIYDNGGDDTLSAVGTETSAWIDLRPAHFSSINTGGIQNGNVAIWYDSQIENAKGGSGADVLIGNDVANELDGGQGNDSLEGGTGADTYVFNGNQFGTDTVLDSDGQGKIRVEGVDLSGGRKQSKTIWRSADNKTEYHFNKDPALGQRGTLRIYRTGLVKERNSITVQNWRQSELGITLEATAVQRSAAPPGETSTSYALQGDLHAPLANQGTDQRYAWEQDRDTYVAEPGFADVYNHWGGVFDGLAFSGLGGNDAVFGFSGHDTLQGGADDDLISGGLGENELSGGEGRDILSVLDFNIAWRPQIGRVGPQDQWVAPTGAQVISQGASWGAYRDAQGQLRFSAGDEGQQPVGAGAPFELVADPLHPDYQSWGSDIDAGAGDDMAFGGLTSDSIRMGSGNDLAFGFAGHDDIFGEDGNDRIYGDRQAFSTNGSLLTGLPPLGSMTLSADGDDWIDGGLGDDLLVGDYGNNSLFGGEGNDILVGGFDFGKRTVIPS